MQYLIVIIFIGAYLVFDKSLGFSTTSPFYTHFTYMFQHASWMHLVLNSISFVIMFKVLTNYVNKHKLFIISMAIGFIASFFSEHLLPTVGASSMVYAMLGMMYGLVCREIVSFKKDILVLNVGFMVTSMIISYSTVNSNFSIHLISLLLGFGVGVINSKYLKV